MNKFLPFLLLLLIPALHAQNNVLYGEHDLGKLSAIYFDKKGTIYPDHRIANKKLESAHASLKEFYKTNPNDFTQVAQLYHCNFSVFSDSNFAILNDSIIRAKIKVINDSEFAGNSITILIHGFRKPFSTINGDSSSVDDFTAMKDNITVLGSTTCYVEVYWGWWL